MIFCLCFSSAQIKRFSVSPMLDFLVSVLLSTHIERFSVSRRTDFFLVCCQFFLQLCKVSMLKEMGLYLQFKGVHFKDKQFYVRDFFNS